MNPYTARRELANRAGFTLLELLIALTLFIVIAGAVTRVLRTQQRFLHGAAELGEMRSQLRQAVHVLPSELRAVSPMAGDVYEWSSTAVKFRSVTGASVVCRRLSDAVVVLPPPGGAERDERRLTTWMVAPQPGDSLLVYDEGDLGSGDDTWRAFEIAAVATATQAEQCDASSGLYARDVLPDPAIRVRLSSGSATTTAMGVGAAIRIFRPVRYALYLSGDSRWYLGASDCNATRVPPCSSVQPISGPYQARDGSGGGGGLSLTFESRSGRPLLPGVDDPREIALIRMVVRAESASRWWGAGRDQRTVDSLVFAVAVRDRSTPAVEYGR